MKLAACVAALAAAVLVSAPSGAAAGPEKPTGPKRPVRFAVISDPHYYDNSLGTEGAAFELYLAQDRKLIRESHAILVAAIDRIIASRVDFVLVSGDLTKDGELRSHLGFARQLQRLERRGIKVYVVPGNHDISNPEAFAYRGDETRRVANVPPWLFKALYHQFGYGEALWHAPDSLSYVVEPAQGLWVIGIDSCKYRDNESLDHAETSGRISDATMAWIQRVLERADAKGKRVMAFLHHGVVEHFTGQSGLFPEYVLDDWRERSAALARAGLPIVFTGHFHAHDVTRATLREDGDSEPVTIHDVETGSLVTYPSPYRIVTVKPDGGVEFATHHVTEIDYDTRGQSFPDYSLAYLQQGMLGIVTAQLVQGYGLPVELAQGLAPYLTAGFVAHYAGNETPDAAAAAMIGSLVGSPDPLVRMLGGYLFALWSDLEPDDLAPTLHLWPARVPGRHRLPF